MDFKIASPAATSVSSILPRHKGAELYALPKRPIAGMHPKAATSDHPEVRAGVRPELLAETQAIVFPAGIALSALAAEIFYFDVILHSSAPGTFYLGAGALAAIVMFLIAGLSDLNSTASIIAGEAKARVILLSASISFALLLCLFNLLNISGSFPWGWFALWYSFSVIFLLAARCGILLWARLLKAERRLLQRVAIYGSIDLAVRVRDQLFTGDSNLVLSGIFTDDGPERSPGVLGGGMECLINAAQSGACDRIILAMPSVAKGRILETIAELDVLPIDVQLCPDAMTLPSEISGMSGAGGLVLLDLQRPPLNARGILFKTAMDYVLAVVALIVFSPLMLAIAAAVKLDSRGPVFFVQRRHGYNQRIIRVAKFRSMTVAEDGAVVTQAVRGDNRVTRVGRFLRRTSLDELPQLFNVLRGELSLVGPRPHAVAHNESYSRVLARYANRHKVKPGITGWAQVNGCRGETKTPEDMCQRVELDLHYIKNWSLWLDIQILARTTLVPFHSSNAY
jgi:putative colanic acid biosynthesis UDP-glucose lipid carrier transferase